MPRAPQVRSQERDAEQALLGEEAELMRHERKDGGDIHVARMVRHEDVGGFGVELFDAFGARATEAHGQQHSRPDAGDGVLRVAGAVEERRHERERAHDYGREHDQRDREEQGQEQTHRFA